MNAGQGLAMILGGLYKPQINPVAGGYDVDEDTGDVTNSLTKKALSDQEIARALHSGSGGTMSSDYDPNNLFVMPNSLARSFSPAAADAMKANMSFASTPDLDEMARQQRALDSTSKTTSDLARAAQFYGSNRSNPDIAPYNAQVGGPSPDALADYARYSADSAAGVYPAQSDATQRLAYASGAKADSTVPMSREEELRNTLALNAARANRGDITDQFTNAIKTGANTSRVQAGLSDTAVTNLPLARAIATQEAANTYGGLRTVSTGNPMLSKVYRYGYDPETGVNKFSSDLVDSITGDPAKSMMARALGSGGQSIKLPNGSVFTPKRSSNVYIDAAGQQIQPQEMEAPVVRPSVASTPAQAAIQAAPQVSNPAVQAAINKDAEQKQYTATASSQKEAIAKIQQLETKKAELENAIVRGVRSQQSYNPYSHFNDTGSRNVDSQAVGKQLQAIEAELAKTKEQLGFE